MIYFPVHGLLTMYVPGWQQSPCTSNVSVFIPTSTPEQMQIKRVKRKAAGSSAIDAVIVSGRLPPAGRHNDGIEGNSHLLTKSHKTKKSSFSSKKHKADVGIAAARQPQLQQQQEQQQSETYAPACTSA